jgi:hypothetical protein
LHKDRKENRIVGRPSSGEGINSEDYIDGKMNADSVKKREEKTTEKRHK